jgi:hypothetical protein
VKHIFMALLCITVFSCTKEININSTETMPLTSPKSDVKLREIAEIPRYFPEGISSFQVDLRAADLRNFDLIGREYDLYHSIFDNYTEWPSLDDVYFEPDAILETNLSPGLNIKNLHERGIDGRGINLAIIDQPQNIIHQEFTDHLILAGYYPPGCDVINSMHGPYVTGHIIGTNSGIAPGSNVYFYSSLPQDGNQEFTYEFDIAAMEEIQKHNETSENKITILSLSQVSSPDRKFYHEYEAKILELENSGITVITADLPIRNPEYSFYGLRKDALADPEVFSSYYAIPWDEWILKIHNFPFAQDVYKNEFTINDSMQLPVLFPLDFSRTNVGMLGPDNYYIKFVGGWSGLPPTISGLFALAIQMDPEITFDEFWHVLYTTGRSYDFQANNKIMRGRIINPEAMIEYIINDV